MINLPLSLHLQKKAIRTTSTGTTKFEWFFSLVSEIGNNPDTTDNRTLDPDGGLKRLLHLGQKTTIRDHEKS